MSDKQLNSVQSPTDAAMLRKKAEEQARTMESTSLATQPPEEIQRLIHELRVCRIELEMQNGELRTAQAEIEAERACYFDLYDHAPTGYCTLSEKGLILEANLTAATLLGVTRSALVKQPISRFILKEDLDIYYLYRKHLFAPGDPQESELRLVKPDGTLFWVHLTATAAQAEDGAPVCRMIFSDITKRKEAERELFLKENIIKSSSCAIATCDLAGNMTAGNPFFLKLWEFNRLEDFLGKPFQNFWMLDGYDEEIMRALQSEGTCAGELKGIKKDGSLFDVQVSAATVLDDTGSPIALTSTSIDITERKRREIYHEMGQEVLQILNEPGDLLEAIERIIVVLKTVTGVDAVGLRLQDGEDFPYFSQNGFSQDFLLAENSLIKRGKDGGVCRDKDDNICLECTCGLVISGKTDPSNPLFTQGGSCWTSDSFPLLDLPSDQDPRLHPRNNCIHQGYASVALIPVRTRERIMGLIQLNGKRKGLFTLETIEVLEGIAVHIGSTLMRKHAEESLLAERKRLEFVIDGSSLGTWVWNVQTNEVIFSQAWAAMLGYTLEELMPTSVETWIALTHPEDSKKAETLLALCLAEETWVYTCELRMKHKEGHWVWILARGRIMTWDDTGKPLSMFGTHDNITERKHHEQQLSNALSEKEVLLREVHHRVKNNLAGIISLIDLQRRTLEDPNGQIILTELSSRIRSMSLVHEKLYRADSLSSIDFHDYIQALISHLRTTFASADIICRVDAPGITIPLDLASPCGLIVNELVTNVLKYAFPDGKPRPGNTDCRVLVRLHRDKDTYTLTVADNGIGWPAEFDWTEPKTLGMTLVRMLGQHQLGGRYVVDQENGTSITLTFTDKKKKAPVHG